MGSGISLHVGVNKPVQFPGHELLGCVNDAQAMQQIAQSHGFFRSDLLKDPDATRPRVIERLQAAAHDLHGGDIFLFTFAGHGSFIEDIDLDELDHFDETLVLNDFMLSDDVLRLEIWPRFEPGVRILMISDSCLSGGVATFAISLMAFGEAENEFSDNLKLSLTTQAPNRASQMTPAIRTISDEARRQHLEANKSYYNSIYAALPASASIDASVLLLAACGETESTQDGDPHGVFTQALLDVLSGPTPSQNYGELLQGIRSKLLGRPQTPLLTPVGKRDAAFLAQEPFTR